MFITVQPSSEDTEKAKKEKLRVAVDEISEYRNYPDKGSKQNKALITYKDFAGKKPLIVLHTAEELDELIAKTKNQ